MQKVGRCTDEGLASLGYHFLSNGVEITLKELGLNILPNITWSTIANFYREQELK